MNIQDCVKFANEHTACYLATVDQEGWPRTRPMRLWFADENGFHFSSHEAKNVIKELRNNNRAEICFYAPNPDGTLGTILRVCGEIEFVDDLDYKRRLLKERPYIKTMYGVEKVEDFGPVVFRLFKGEAYFWTREYSIRESEIEKIRF